MATDARAKRKQFTPPNGLLIPPTVPPEEKGPNIAFTRLEVTALLPKWELVADCLEGQDKIKAREDMYLPRPNASDKSPENQERYLAYLLRAVFYNVTRRTLEGLVGQVFSRDPIVVIPDRMQPIWVNADGAGAGLDQQAKTGLAMTIAYGRFGVLVDYPKTDGPVSLADQEKGAIRPTLTQYGPKSIINWRTTQIGAELALSLVVLSEIGVVNDDGFEVTTESQFRVLELINEQYFMSTWRWNADEEDYETIIPQTLVTNAKGEPLTRIPFFICGSVDNDMDPDLPPLYDLAVLNIAHYRNSADYEDSCYMVGQPTPYFAGLTENWVNKVLKGTITLGSRSAIPLPVGGTAGLLQVSENSMPMEAMKHKESQMLALGAKLIEPGGGSNTFGQAQLEESTESSMLATSAKNVSAVYTAALKVAAELNGDDPSTITYSLNTDFPASRLTPNERTQTVLEWQAGAITQSEMRAIMRKAGVASLEMADYEKELKTNPPPVPQAMQNNQGKGGADNQPNPNKDAQNNGGNQAGN